MRGFASLDQETTPIVRRAASEAIEVRLLGPLEATRGDERLALGGPKPRALLALLALDVGRVVSVDRLVEELWPATPPDSAPHAVQVYVSQLRKSLGDTIVREGPGYSVRLDPNDVDVHRFVRLAGDGHAELGARNPAAAASTLREALALWRGPALADFTYEPFAQSEIARLDELRFAVLEDRVDADIALGRHAELVTEIDALIEAQPLRERPRALLMRALYLAGRQADALAAYRSARETFLEELGIDPGPDLRALEAAILRQDESLVPERASASAIAAVTRRLVAVLAVGLEVDADDVEAEEALLGEAASAVVAAATRHGGIAERLPDGSVTATFGVPVTHEDDPLRAARAAVEVCNALAANDGVTFFGAIDAGEVVASDRTASGPPFRAAGLLRQSAAAGEILLSKAAALRLGQLAVVQSRPEGAALIELLEPSPAAVRVADTPLVGRKREFQTLRAALRRTKAGGAPGAAVVVGPPGVGKSRLAAELMSGVRGTEVLWGRCLSYGDGVTYGPVREMLDQCAACPERDDVVAALDSAASPPAAEIALRFRRLCEARARMKPLALVFDDVHWAEPTLLDLVEHVVDKGEGAIFVVCLAREELLDERPGFLKGRNSHHLRLEALSNDEAESLLELLGGTTLERSQRLRVVETAQGNPFFVEQLFALARESGLGEHALPETVRALLAARIDRLGPGERAVLERGAVVGGEFTSDDVVTLLDATAAPTAEQHLETLTSRGFVRPRDDAFVFRHVLVQEAVYRSAPKRLRSELHERFADRLDEAHGTLPNLDEFVGYHLEQAHALRSELGERDRRTERLAEDAGRRLGIAGMRAWRRGDATTTIGLLERATGLLRSEDSWRLELLCELGLALRSAGDAGGARASLLAASEHALALGDRRIEARARIEALFLDAVADVGRADELADAASAGIPVLETFGDDRALGRAWLLLGWVRGGIQCQYEAWETAAEKALVHYRLAGSPPATCLGQIAGALYWGPAPVGSATRRCAELLDDAAADLDSRAHLNAYLGGLEAQRGDFDRARLLVADARQAYEDLGHVAAVATHCDGVAGEIELLAGDYRAAQGALLTACAYFESTGYQSELATRAADLAEAHYRLDELDEADRWVTVSETHAADGFLSAQVSWRPVRAKILARRGEVEQAETIVRDAILRADTTDGLNRRAKAYRDLGEVLAIAAREAEASAAFDHAVALYERKGNTAGVARTRAAAEAAGAKRRLSKRGRPPQSVSKH